MRGQTCAVVASEPWVEKAMREFAGNAVDHVVAAVFAACAYHKGVLLGPVQLLCGGVGAGLHALDGRVRQPGLGVSRPRGFVTEQEIPLAARVGVPLLPGALMTLLSIEGTLSLLDALGPALEIARSRSMERFSCLSLLAEEGPSVLSNAALSAPLCATAGRLAGGLLTEADLEAARPVLDVAQTFSYGSRTVATLPWLWEDKERPVQREGTLEIVLAADRNGLLAAGCYEVALEGLAIPALGLQAPLHAAPVRRSVRRLRPGTPLPSAASLCLLAEKGCWELALGGIQGAQEEAGIDTLVTHLLHTERGLGYGVPAELGMPLLAVSRRGAYSF